MKKIALILCVALIFSFAACKGNNEKEKESRNTQKEDISEHANPEELVKIGKSYTDFGGVNIEIKAAKLDSDDPTLEVEWINKTAYRVLYGDPYLIEHFSNGEWKSCQIKSELAFNSVGYELAATTTQKKEYKLCGVFEVSKKGKYRISSRCSVYEKGEGENPKECKLWAEFTLKADLATDFVYCGNTMTTIYIGEERYTFMGGDSVTLTDLLRRLEYTDRVCDCLPEYRVDTEFGTDYGVNISGTYVKYKGQQAELTEAQAETIKEIIERVKASKPDKED